MDKQNYPTMKRTRRSQLQLKRNVTFLEDQNLLKDEMEAPLSNSSSKRLRAKRKKLQAQTSENLQDKEPLISYMKEDDDLEQSLDAQNQQEQPKEDTNLENPKYQSQQNLNYRPLQMNQPSTNPQRSNEKSKQSVPKIRSFMSGSDKFAPKNNSMQSFGSHMDEFKILEEFSRNIVDLKIEANSNYQQGNYQNAGELFNQILDQMHSLQERFKSEDFILSTNILSIFKESHLNFALCHIKMSNYENAIDILSALLHYEPQNVKALYLRGKSYFALREYEQSLIDFRYAKELKPQESALFDQYIEELEISINNMQRQDDPMLKASVNLAGFDGQGKLKLSKAQSAVKEKRGGLIQEGDVQKSIDDILNIRKPRTIFHLLKMVYTVSKNFALSMNAFVLVLFGYVLYYYLIKRRLFCLVAFRLLDKIA